VAHAFVGAPEGRSHPAGATGASARNVIIAFALCCGLASLALVLAGFPLVGGTLHAISQASAGAQTTLAPLGRLLGEQDFGPLTESLVGTGEGLMFGIGLGFGLSRKNQSQPSVSP
jgi:hypothetical protein